MSQTRTHYPRVKWTVWDPDRENAHHFRKRSDADNRMHTAEDLDIDAELYPPGELPDALEDVEAEPDAFDDSPLNDTDSAKLNGVGETDGGTGPVEATVIDHTESRPDGYELPERSVGEDPFEWMPGEFVDVIDGSEAINRKGFEVLAHFYEIDVHADLQVAPEENGHEYARVKAVATTPKGRQCEAYGSAHVDRGDDASLLLEMADTRARKRALSIATGVGAVAVEELRNEVEK